MAIIDEAQAKDEQCRRLAQIFGWLSRCYREVGNSDLAARYESRSRSLGEKLDSQTREVVESELRAA